MVTKKAPARKSSAKKASAKKAAKKSLPFGGKQAAGFAKGGGRVKRGRGK